MTLEHHLRPDRTGPTARIGRLAWLRVGVAVAAVGWGANQFAPLLLVYRADLGVPDTAVQATFGCYALGLVPALLVCGRRSDRVGRRPVMTAALIASALAGAVLLVGGAAHVPGMLFVGRLLAGIASGAAFSAGAAWIKELSDAAHGSGPRRVTVTMTVGFGAGPLVAGLLAQWAPAPLVLPYLPQLVLLGVALAVTARVPETAVSRTVVSGTVVSGTVVSGTVASGRLGRADRDARQRRFRAVVLPLAPWVFGAAAVALAYLPGLVQDAVGTLALAFTAVVTMLTAGAGIVVQPLARRLDGTALITVALGVVIAGLLVAALAAATRSPGGVVVAALVLGAGYGACQVCGLQEVTRLARPDALAGLTAGYQAVSYIGFALPFVLAASAELWSPAVLLTAVAVLAAGTLAWTATASRRVPVPA